MANSKVGQYRLEFDVTGFTSPSRSHVIGIWVAPTTSPTPGTLATDIDVQLLGGGTETLQAVALDYANRVRPMYNAAIGLGSFNLWRYATEYSRDFITAGTVAPTAATGGGISIGHGVILTFRHALGGIGKHVFLETEWDLKTKTNLVVNPSGSSIERFAAWVMSSVSPCIALDNSFPVAPLKNSQSENESVFKKVYRQ